MDFLFMLGGFHGGIFFVTALIILYTDHRGFNYFKGKESTLPEGFIKWSHRSVWLGLILMISTGILLAIPAWEYRLTEPTFYIKMTFVLVLLMNAIAIGKLSKKSSSTPFNELSSDDKKTLLVSGALSAMGWIGAASIGLFML